MKSLRNERKITVPPLRAICKHCLECLGGSRRDVAECGMADCPLYPFRFGKKVKVPPAATRNAAQTGKSPVKAIRAHCVMCMGGSFRFVCECMAEVCWCWRFRIGKNPNRQGVGASPEELKRRLSKVFLPQNQRGEGKQCSGPDERICARSRSEIRDKPGVL